MLPTLVDEAPKGSDWIHEIKYDGWRTQIVIDHGSIKVFTRNGHDWTEKFAPIAAAAASLPAFTAIMDGEMIVTDVEGKPDFGALKGAIKGAPGRLTFVAFDLLLWNGRDLRARKLTERRRQLWPLVEPAHGKIQFSHEIAGEGPRFFEKVEAMGLEGIVSKRTDSVYLSGRTREWVKIKSFAEATFDIIGVQREPGQPAMVLMADQGRYLGGAFVTLPRGIRERLWPGAEGDQGRQGGVGEARPARPGEVPARRGKAAPCQPAGLERGKGQKWLTKRLAFRGLSAHIFSSPGNDWHRGPERQSRFRPEIVGEGVMPFRS